MSTLTTNEVAERLGISSIRIRVLIREGRLPAEKRGRDYFIDEKDLKLIADRKPGRPAKTPNVLQAAKTSKASKKDGKK